MGDRPAKLTIGALDPGLSRKRLTSPFDFGGGKDINRI